MGEVSNTKQNIYLIIGILLITVLIGGGTYAYISNAVNVKNNVVAGNTTCFNIVYDTGEDITGTLFPSSSPSGGLNGSVSVGISPACLINGVANLYLNVTDGSEILFQTVEPHCENSQTLKTMKDYTNKIGCERQTNGKWVTNGTALKYALYDSSDISNGVPINVGYISQTGIINLYDNFSISSTMKNYYVYVWLDGNLSDNTYQNQSFNGNISADAVQISVGDGSVNPPVLDSGMIPITISEDGVATTVSSTDSTWYNYKNKEWANVVLVKSSGTQTRDYYKSNIGVTVAEDDILAYYVWIPRYKYKIWTLDNSSAGQEQSIDIVFETPDVPVTKGTQVGDYITHPAFVWDDKTVAGIWVGKFETGHSTLASSTMENNLGCIDESCSNADGLIIKPDVVSLRYNNISNEFYASRSMTRSGNQFGLSSSTTDTHMMKNSEWGAVAYLSHSRYGINGDVYRNNSSASYTGRSGGNVSNSVKEFGEIYDDWFAPFVTESYHGYYTWNGREIIGVQEWGDIGEIGDYVSDRTLGTKASTTGNITGVYDMSGGVDEHVMGNYNDVVASSGFEAMPDSKYYDKYVTSSLLTSCNGRVCFGHALSETFNWHLNYATNNFSNLKWVYRGGSSDGVVNGSNTFGSGLFCITNFFDGGGTSPYGFRIVAIVD